MADKVIARAYGDNLPIYTTKNATAVSKTTLVASTAQNIALNDNTSNIEIFAQFDELLYVKFKTASGDTDASTTNYDSLISSKKPFIDLGRYATTSEKTTHISLFSESAGDVFVIEK